MKYHKEIDFAKRLALESGEIIRRNFLAGTIKEWKADGTPVTETDSAVNSLVIEKVQETFPTHGIIGEEESIAGQNEYLWVCDPLDGTMPFSHGLPVFTFSLALVKDGKPVVGVVFDPMMNRLFYASVGSGAILNDKKIQVSTHDTVNHSLIDIEGFPTVRHAIDIGSGIIDELNGFDAHLTTFWSAILPTALIASGHYAAALYNLKKFMDGAAIKIIVEEAGGRVTDLLGNEQRYDQPINGFIASNGNIHDDLVRLVTKYAR